MGFRRLACVTVLAAAVLTPIAAQAFDDSKYPDLKGEWRRVAVPSGRYPGVQFDPHKPSGPGQQAPLTPEYQAIFEANLADQAQGGQAGDPTYRCLSPGMPRIMGPYGEMEIVVMPDTTYILIDHIHDNRRIHTDGRDFPANMAENPRFAGYSIGRWVDEDNDGRYDTLLVETRGMKGPRTYEMTRHSAARGQPDDHQGADLSRQDRSEHAARRNHHHRPCADPSLDRHQGLPPHADKAADLVG